MTAGSTRDFPIHVKGHFVWVLGLVEDEWESKIEGAGGHVHNKIKKDTHCLVVSGVLDNKEADMRKEGLWGVNKEVVPKKKNINDAGSQLAPPLGELMKMLFNAYRAAMMEFEINMSEMPLEKLSKSNIQKDTFL
ncbi:hypothetical protein TEA_021931 [Camellia sinensis var. sinensis]|uniref:PARP alpha-helical domain-containing protein n=1 Tax=Camellia sinensis var. sinensis TaxID=542762 RepID=A0A4S4DKI5_CAMSN|nr:hypothetical protein TEA_021931 [Camellia sinensis var. sinensis]